MGHLTNPTRKKLWITVVLAFSVAVFAGRWGKGLFTESEYVHFSINFPTQPGFEALPRSSLQSPWARIPDDQWNGYPSGGLIVWGQEGSITVDIGRQGWIKDLLQPWNILLSTHWLRNIGTNSRRIRIDFDPCGMPTTWLTFERNFDNSTNETTRLIEPGATFNMDWSITVPETRRNQRIICDTEIRIYDADSDDLLTVFPISIRNSQERQ